jgi:hypothetical protein
MSIEYHFISFVLQDIMKNSQNPHPATQSAIKNRAFEFTQKVNPNRNSSRQPLQRLRSSDDLNPLKRLQHKQILIS